MLPDEKTSVSELLGLVPQLRAYARALTRNPVDADDLVQETLVRALANLASFTPGTIMRAWLFTIMRNAFLTQVGKVRRESTGKDCCASELLTSLPNHDWVIEGARIMRALNQLPDHYREVLVLVVMLGESYEDAAALCGVGIGTVKSRVSRGRQMLVDILGRDSLTQ
jgi:RNA polymerase sigma-70 factor (ECF subfamily)